MCEGLVPGNRTGLTKQLHNNSAPSQSSRNVAEHSLSVAAMRSESPHQGGAKSRGREALLREFVLFGEPWPCSRAASAHIAPRLLLETTWAKVVLCMEFKAETSLLLILLHSCVPNTRQLCHPHRVHREVSLMWAHSRIVKSVRATQDYSKTSICEHSIIHFMFSSACYPACCLKQRKSTCHCDKCLSAVQKIRNT